MKEKFKIKGEIIMSNKESELLAKITEIESSLLQRITQLEAKLAENEMLVADFYRYGKLRDLLAAEKWKEADKQTTRVMLEVMGHEDQENLTPKDVKSFPCNAIQVIDQLWRKYSGDRFGFSVQLHIYLDIGGSSETLMTQNMKIMRSLGERIGWWKNNNWLKYDEFDFAAPPDGAFPGEWWHSPYGEKMANFFFARLLVCGL